MERLIDTEEKSRKVSCLFHDNLPQSSPLLQVPSAPESDVTMEEQEDVKEEQDPADADLAALDALMTDLGPGDLEQKEQGIKKCRFQGCSQGGMALRELKLHYAGLV